MPYLKIYESSTGGYVELHPLHGSDELPANSEAARVLANFGHRVQLLPALPAANLEGRLLLLPDVYGFKNPDIRIDENLIGDIKTPSTAIGIRQITIGRCIHACAQQKVAIAVINLRNRHYTIRDVKKGIIGALQPDRNKSIQQVWVVTATGNLFKVQRPMVFDESIYSELELL